MTGAIGAKVLVIGATSGIGRGLAEAIARKEGKTVVACGRRQERLDELKKELPNIKTFRFDISKVDSIYTQLDQIFKHEPLIDTVLIAAGMQSYFDLRGEKWPVQEEINTNLLGPIEVARYTTQYFQRQATSSASPKSVIFIGSGLGFIPLPKMSIYCSTKAALHTFAISLRSSFEGSNIKIVEVIPPYVATELDQSFADQMKADRGGQEGPKPMPLDEFVPQALKGLEQGKAEVGVGFGTVITQTWRQAFSPYLERFHIKG